MYNLKLYLPNIDPFLKILCNRWLLLIFAVSFMITLTNFSKIHKSIFEIHVNVNNLKFHIF